MSSTVNEWYVFNKGAVSVANCNKLKRWASKKWKPSAVAELPMAVDP